MAQQTLEACQANVATGECPGCTKLARRVVQQTLDIDTRTTHDQELLTEAALPMVGAVIESRFPVAYFGDPSLAGSLHCGDRRRVVSEVAVAIATQYNSASAQ